MKVLVTGASGFIGSHVAELLVNEGYDVVGMAHSGDKLNYLDEISGIKKVVGDIRDFAFVKIVMKGCDWVFHLAGMLNNPFNSFDDFFSTNVEGTKNVMQAALELGVKKVVHTSSCVTIKENVKKVNEDYVHSGDFDGYYARTKFLGEKVAFEYGARGLPVVVVNPTIVYGPRSTAMTGFFKMHLQPKIRFASYLDARLNVIYVGDVAQGHLLAMKKGRPGHRYLLGGEEISMEEFLRCLDKVAGIRRPVVKLPKFVINAGSSLLTPLALLLKVHFPLLQPQVNAMKRGSAVDASKAQKELAFKITPLEEGLRETVRWYRETGIIRF